MKKSKTPRLFWKLAEFAAEVNRTEYELIQMAATGFLALSVYFDGMLFRIEGRDLRLRFIQFFDGLLVLPPHQAFEFTKAEKTIVSKLTGRIPCMGWNSPEMVLDVCGVPGPWVDDYRCLPELRCEGICSHASRTIPAQFDSREFFPQTIKKGELSGLEPMDYWELDTGRFPEYSIADLLVNTKEADRVRILYFDESYHRLENVPGGTGELQNPQGSTKKPRLDGWDQIEEEAGVSKKTILRAQTTLKIKPVVHSEGNKVWAAPEELHELMAQYSKYKERKVKEKKRANNMK